MASTSGNVGGLPCPICSPHLVLDAAEDRFGLLVWGGRGGGRGGGGGSSCPPPPIDAMSPHLLSWAQGCHLHEALHPSPSPSPCSASSVTQP